MMKKDEDIFKKHLGKEATKKESNLLKQWYNFYSSKSSGNKTLSEEELLFDLKQIKDAVLSRAKDKKPKVSTIYPYVVAACVVFICVLAIFITVNISTSKSKGSSSLAGQFPYYLKVEAWTHPVDKYHAYVRNNRGEVIDLEQPTNNFEDGIETLSDGTIQFTNKNPVLPLDLFKEIQTVYVPRSKQRKIILPDGSQVWLNSESSISFPKGFSSNERVVEVSGELFFEVVKEETNRPFVVKSKNTEIQVLGTSFNFSGYLDEEIETTAVVSGSVKVSSIDKDNNMQSFSVLEKGECWVYNTSSKQCVIESIAPEEVTNWMDGLITFKNLGLKSIMKRVSRLYDIDVQFDKNFNHQRRFTGGVSTRVSLEEFLRIMQLYGVDIQRVENVLLIY